MTLAILACDVHKGFGSGASRVPILRGVGLGVLRGETVFLVGPSGSGKTTLLSILGCILSPDQGKLNILGEDVSRLSAEELTEFRRQHLGFIFQSYNLFPTLSALDNIRLAMVMCGTPLPDATERAYELLDQVGLGPRAHLRPAQLSTGECQRVAIARALANEPALLLADEPTASLDAENGQNVMRLLHNLVHDRGVTLVVVTHDNRIFSFADRIVRLEDGRLTRAWKSGVRDQESGVREQGSGSRGQGAWQSSQANGNSQKPLNGSSKLACPPLRANGVPVSARARIGVQVTE